MPSSLSASYDVNMMNYCLKKNYDERFVSLILANSSFNYTLEYGSIVWNS